MSEWDRALAELDTYVWIAKHCGIPEAFADARRAMEEMLANYSARAIEGDDDAAVKLPYVLDLSLALGDEPGDYWPLAAALISYLPR